MCTAQQSFIIIIPRHLLPWYTHSSTVIINNSQLQESLFTGTFTLQECTISHEYLTTSQWVMIPHIDNNWSTMKKNNLLQVPLKTDQPHVSKCWEEPHARVVPEQEDECID